MVKVIIGLREARISVKGIGYKSCTRASTILFRHLCVTYQEGFGFVDRAIMNEEEFNEVIVKGGKHNFA